MDAGEARVVGRYRLLRPLGRGGMGTVWHAHDTLLGRDVAIKEILLPSVGSGPADPSDPLVRRALREAQAAARLRHPGIVMVHDVVTDAGRPWIVMELVNGHSLAEVIRDQGLLTERRTAEVGLQVLEALRAAHGAGVAHRDVKPANILIDENRVVLTDFGIAAIDEATALTATGQMVGSPAYLAPERINGQPATVASDLWSLGVTLYTAVTGWSPFQRDDAQSTLAAILNSQPPTPAHAGLLWPVIKGLLIKDPGRRLPTQQAHQLLANVAARPDSPGSGGSTSESRRPRWWPARSGRRESTTGGIPKTLVAPSPTLASTTAWADPQRRASAAKPTPKQPTPEPVGAINPEVPATVGAVDPENAATVGAVNPENAATVGAVDPENAATVGAISPEDAATVGAVNPDDPVTVGATVSVGETAPIDDTVPAGDTVPAVETAPGAGTQARAEPGAGTRTEVAAVPVQAKPRGADHPVWPAEVSPISVAPPPAAPGPVPLAPYPEVVRPRRVLTARTVWLAAAVAAVLLVGGGILRFAWPGPGDDGASKETVVGRSGVGDGGPVQPAAKTSVAVSPSVNPSLDSCLVGTWRMTSMQIVNHFEGVDARFSSNGGAILRIWPDGKGIEDYGRSLPLTAKIKGAHYVEELRGKRTSHNETRGNTFYSSEFSGRTTYKVTRNGRAQSITVSVSASEKLPYICSSSRLTTYGNATLSTQSYVRISHTP